MSRLGSIYVITDKTNGKQYVGQTSRDIWIRFDEHCYHKYTKSKIHKAIEEKGVSNFELKELERVPLELLDEREKYWIQALNTYEDGYNSTRGGSQVLEKRHSFVLIKEKNIVVESKEFLARTISNLTLWNLTFLREQLTKAIETGDSFLDYHFQFTDDNDLTEIDELEDWIKTLNQKFQGKKIHCNELNLDFDTTGAVAQYLVQQKIYQGNSKYPIQSLVTSLGYHLKGQTSNVCNLTFCYAPGTTKQPGGDFKAKKVYCHQLNKTFNSQTEAANYMIDEGYWSGIKVKTAKLRISDIVRGIFPEYKGYTFENIEE